MKFVILTLSIVIYSCTSAEVDDSNLSYTVDSLEQANQELNVQLENLSNDYDTSNDLLLEEPITTEEVVERASKLLAEEKADNRRFAFVLLTVEKKESKLSNFHGTQIMEDVVNTFVVTSQVIEFENFSEDEEFKFIDKVQQNYSNYLISPKHEYITKRQCFAFKTYKEASIAKAKYTVSD